ncbi:hypothetical protein PO909_015335 [Leuciscus waleckii]
MVEGDLNWLNDLNHHFNRFDQPVTPPPTPSPTQLHLIPTPPGQDGLSHIPSTDPPCLPLSFTAVQVRQALRKIKGRKAAGPDGISSRLLKSSADQLSGVMERIFNLSLKLGVVPQLWKTSCVVPVPKTSHPKDLNCYRPVALTSHLMKTLERLVLQHLRSTVGPSMDPLQFAYRPNIGVEDAVIFLQHHALAHLEKPGSTVRIMFFDFSSAFNTIQPMLLKDKLERTGVDHLLSQWVLNYLTNRPQFVRARDGVSDRLMCSTGVPQGTVLAPFLFTLYTADFRNNFGEMCFRSCKKFVLKLFTPSTTSENIWLSKYHHNDQY